MAKRKTVDVGEVVALLQKSLAGTLTEGDIGDLKRKYNIEGIAVQPTSAPKAPTGNLRVGGPIQSRQTRKVATQNQPRPAACVVTEGARAGNVNLFLYATLEEAEVNAGRSMDDAEHSTARYRKGDIHRGGTTQPDEEYTLLMNAGFRYSSKFGSWWGKLENLPEMFK